MTNNVMMALGDFRFSVSTAAYDELNRTHNYRWQSQDRIGRSPGQQFMGEGIQTLDLSGTIYPHYSGGIEQVNQMHSMAGQGKPLILVDGTGKVWGKFVITRVQETQSRFLNNGQALHQDFRLSLVFYGEDQT